MIKAQLPQSPPEIQQIILPNKELSVVYFLKFCLTAATRFFDGSFAPSQKLRSSLTPTITTIEEIQAIPTPPFAVLDELMKAPELSVSQSILSLHAPGFITERLPMWTLSYWVQVFHLRPLKKKWLDTEESLGEYLQSKRRTDDTRSLIKQVHSALACISWAGKLKGFSASITTDHLATYLTKNWFTDEHENQMLYLLQKEVSRTRRGEGIEVCDTFFTKRLLDIQKQADKPDHYASSAHYAWLREKGQELATGVLDMLVTIANIGDNHWVAVVLDFKSSRILYGDSMGGSIDEDVETALTWWIQQHTGRQFTKSYFPITRQRDGYSCGILAWNALAVFLLPETYSLVDAGKVGDERLRMFLQVSDRHNSKVRRFYNCQKHLTNMD
jgi:hypothetical protein